MRDKKSNIGGIGFCDALGIVFIVLKLTGIITWPWYGVLAPIWIPALLAVLIVACHIIKIKLEGWG